MATKRQFESARMTIFAELETLTPAQVREVAERVVEYAEEIQCLSPKERRRK